MMSSSKAYSGSIAIVGGGISGLTTAIALLKRGFNIQIYEQSKRFGEIGAGVAFHSAAERAMMRCDPRIYDAFQSVGTRNMDPAKLHTYFEFYDGRSPQLLTDKDMIFKSTSKTGANSVHRAHFLDELVKLVPTDICHFGKRLDTLEGPDADARYTLKFADGTTAVHDAVIGTDGIKSSVRRWLVGPDSPQAHPVYTHKYAYRGLIPMDKAARELGADMAGNAKAYLGDGGHFLTFPVSKGNVMNVVCFHTDKGDWPDDKHLTRPSTKEQVYKDFEGFGATVRKIIDLLEPDLDCWAIFDTGDNPMDKYNRGKVLVLGDAGHATTPHHGSGAGLCVEDAAIIAELMADERVASAGDQGIVNAFEAYSAERYSRAHRLVRSSRRAGEIYQGRTEIGWDMKTIEKELGWRYDYFWNGDLDEYLKDARHALDMIFSKD